MLTIDKIGWLYSAHPNDAQYVFMFPQMNEQRHLSKKLGRILGRVGICDVKFNLFNY